MSPEQIDFLAGRIHAIKARLAKAQRRIERQEDSGSAISKTEEERAHRLGKLLVLHLNSPEEALLLYNK